MRDTGKVFYVIEGDDEALASRPQLGQSFLVWYEAIDDEDDDLLLYVSNAGMILGFEEFWG